MTTFESDEEEWRAYLEGTHPTIRRGQRTFRFLPARFGFTAWEKNPNICSRCVVGSRTIR